MPHDETQPGGIYRTAQGAWVNANGLPVAPLCDTQAHETAEHDAIPTLPPTAPQKPVQRVTRKVK